MYICELYHYLDLSLYNFITYTRVQQPLYHVQNVLTCNDLSCCMYYVTIQSVYCILFSVFLQFPNFPIC